MLENSNMSTYPEENTSIFLAILHIMSLGLSIVFFFHHRGLECKSRNQGIPGVTGKLGLRVENEAGQRLIEFCQENTLIIANTLFQQHKRRLCIDITRWSILKSD